MTRAADLAKLIAGGAVFNEASADVDFRVESDANTNALIVDGGHSTVGINTAAVSNRTLKIEGEGNLGAGVSLNESTRGGYVEYSAGSGTELYTGSELAITGGGNNNEFLIYTGVSALKIDRSGNSTFANTVTLSDGNVVLADGHGIDFSSTSDAGGMANELLDDYEEGTWTPTLSGSSSGSGTLSSVSARYTKVGRIVHCEFTFVVNSVGSISGNAIIGGFPFSGGFFGGQGAVRNQGFGGDNTDGIVFEMLQSTTTGRFHFNSSTSTQRTVLTSDVSNGDFVAASISYST